MRSRILIVFAFLIGTVSIYSQIVVPDSCFKTNTDYTSTEINDTIFFFPEDINVTSIMADTANYKGYSIQWDEFIPEIGYQPIGTDVEISINLSSEAKGYRLTLTSDTNTAIGRYWFIKNDFNIEILTKDEEGNLSNGAYTAICDEYGPIQVRFDQTDLVYFDHQTSDILFFEPKYIMEWVKELDVPEGKISNQGTSGNIFRYNVVEAYWEDMFYTFVVTDSCGNERRDSVYVRSIQPNANFSLEYITLDDSKYYPGKSEEYYYFYSKENNEDISAPAQYKFINESDNAHEYLWSFGDSIKLRTTKDTVFHIYNYWGDYDVKLTAEHKVQWWNQTCFSDTTIIGSGSSDDGPKKGVSINRPNLKAPNVFSVNSASYLGTWRIQDVTISDFEIAIYARTGRRVHHFKGNIRDWDGWDGRVNNSNDFVTTGVYWYIVKDYSTIRNFDPNIDSKISVENYEGEKRDAPNTFYRGFIHVFNNN